MYLNRAQKYVMELLGEYGCLKKSQLEFMARHKISEYLTDLNGYLNQMRQETLINFRPSLPDDAYICLPDVIPNDSLIDAFDVITAIVQRVENHRKGTGR